MEYDKQVPKSHYYLNYDDKKRWISYWQQIAEVIKTEQKNVLEIGVGNKTVSNYLKNLEIKVLTVDIDDDLNPDYVCSVTELSNYFIPNSFGVVLCSEVLEHIPFNQFEKSLKEISLITNNFAILSIPYSTINFQFDLKLPFFQRKSLFLGVPFPRKHIFNGEHYWEIGKKGYSIGKITTLITKYFDVVDKYRVPENPYHMFFILQVKT